MTTWPDGTVATRYAFGHALYQQVVYERLGARRVRLHQRLGGCLETAYGAQAGAIAAELAEHFVRGQDTQRAVQYLHRAAENALHRWAQVEAINHLTRGLELLTTRPETPERLQHELDLLVLLGAAWARLRGWAAPEVGQAYTRARVLCQRLERLRSCQRCCGDNSSGVSQYGQNGRRHTSWESTCAPWPSSRPTGLPPVRTHHARGQSLLSWGGGHGTRPLRAGERAVWPSLPPHPGGARRLGVFVRCYAALSLWLLGAPEQALAQMYEARTLAQELSHPYSLAFALTHGTRLHHWRRDVPATLT